MTHICFIIGENKSGKTYLQEKLLTSSDKFKRLIYTTSRDKRPGEEDGIHYNFKSHEAIKGLIDNRKTLQHVEFGGSYYCTTIEQYKTDDTLLFACTPDAITDTMSSLFNSGDSELISTRFSIIYCMASKSLLESRGLDERSKRGNITEDFMKAYNDGVYSQIPMKILSDSDLMSDNVREIKDFLKVEIK